MIIAPPSVAAFVPAAACCWSGAVRPLGGFAAIVAPSVVAQLLSARILTRGSPTPARHLPRSAHR